MCWPAAGSLCTAVATTPSLTMWVDFSFFRGLPKANTPYHLPSKQREMNGLVRKGQSTAGTLAFQLPGDLSWSPDSPSFPAGQLFKGPEQKVIAGLSQTVNQRSSFNDWKTRTLYLSNGVTSQESVCLFWSSQRIGNSHSKWPSLTLIEWSEHLVTKGLD